MSENINESRIIGVTIAYNYIEPDLSPDTNINIDNIGKISIELAAYINFVIFKILSIILSCE